jgi:hypothetical protein
MLLNLLICFRSLITTVAFVGHCYAVFMPIWLNSSEAYTTYYTLYIHLYM